MIRLAIIGVTGRMGRALVCVAREFPELRLASAVASAASPGLGRDSGELSGAGRNAVAVTGDLRRALAAADVAVDFSSPDAVEANLAACREMRRALLIGTTGYPAALHAAFDSAAAHIPLLVAPNTSLGVTVLLELVQAAARALPPAYDIEILDAHHRTKRDAPSGTALALGEAAAAGRGQFFDRTRAAISGSGARMPGEIGFSAVRAGDLVGEHSVMFAGTGERLTLQHQATDRAVFARGALQAASWLAARPPGRYFMRDIVPIKSGS